MLHITLTTKALANDPTDPLKRTHYGWGEHDSIKQNWENNRGYYVLGERADKQSYVAFSHNGAVVMIAKITGIVPAEGKPGKRIINGRPLGPGEPIWDAYVGGPTPERAIGVRNPVTYVQEDEAFGRRCGCGCGELVFEGEFVRGHDQTALHQRVAKIGTVREFIRWFDAIEAGGEASVPKAPVKMSADGSLDLSVVGGEVTLSFRPVS
jgi:hypothetical protein